MEAIMAVENSKRRGRLLGKGGDDWRDPESRRDPYPPRLSQTLAMTGACCKTCDKWFTYGSSNKQKYCSRSCHRVDRYK